MSTSAERPPARRPLWPIRTPAPFPPLSSTRPQTCGCCNLWVDHLREAGFQVDARNVDDIIPVKIDAGVPPRMSSCHTALIDGYVVEGHIPAEHVKRLLSEIDVLAPAVCPQRFLIEVHIHAAGQGIGHHKRGGGQVIGAHVGVDPTFKIPIARQHGAGYQIVLFYGPSDGFRKGGRCFQYRWYSHIRPG